MTRPCTPVSDDIYGVRRCVNATLCTQEKRGGSVGMFYYCPLCRERTQELDQDLYGRSSVEKLPRFELLRAEGRSARQQRYDEYRKTPAWQRRRNAVMARAERNGVPVCEGCGQGIAAEVHHLTYDHMEAEYLWELVAVCRPCHETVGGYRVPDDSPS